MKQMSEYVYGFGSLGFHYGRKQKYGLGEDKKGS